jgi:hypothetical protein
MYKRSRPLVALLAAAGTAAVAIPAIAGGQTGPKTIVLGDKLLAAKIVHVSRSPRGDQLGLGDRVITEQAIYSPSTGRKLGTLSTDCVNVAGVAQLFNARLQCLTTYRFSNGTIIAAGVERLADPKRQIPLIGGTGAYSTTRGSVTAGAPTKRYDTVDVVQVTGS